MDACDCPFTVPCSPWMPDSTNSQFAGAAIANASHGVLGRVFMVLPSNCLGVMEGIPVDRPAAARAGGCRRARDGSEGIGLARPDTPAIFRLPGLPGLPGRQRRGARTGIHTGFYRKPGRV